MLGSIKRKNPQKKWTQIYADRVEDLKSEKMTQKETYTRSSYVVLPSRMEDSSTLASSSTMGDDEATSAKTNASIDSYSTSFSQSTQLREMIKQLPTCKRTEHNVVPPPKQMEWKHHWGSQLVCYVCSYPALNDCVTCTKCNLICHRLCMENMHLNIKQSGAFGVSFKAHSLNSHAARYESPVYENRHRHRNNTEKHHRCPFCEEAFIADLQHYYHIIESLRESKLHQMCANVIIRRVMVFLERCRLLNKKRSIIHIQSIVRGILARKKFRQSIRTNPRVALIKVHMMPAFLRDISHTLQYHKDYIVVVTVHDTFKNTQIFRFEKSYESILHDIIFIPGITYNHTIVMNFGIRDENYFNGNNYYWLFGQAQIAVRDIRKQLESSEIVLNIIDKITVCCL